MFANIDSDPGPLTRFGWILVIVSILVVVVAVVLFVIFLIKQNQPRYRDFDEHELERENARLRQEVAELRRNRGEPPTNDPSTRQRETGYSDNEPR
jgi:hypothetical protein